MTPPAPAPRLAAYVLTGDPTWLRSSLARYYDLLDDLVVLVPSDALSWTGDPLPVQACLDAVASVDERGIARRIEGRWTDRERPLRAENQQRQAGLDALAGADWILQIDNDEVLPDVAALLPVLAAADAEGLPAVEWPMRVIFRRLPDGGLLEVVASDGGPRYDYPGPIAVRPGTRLVDCRRTDSAWLRPTVTGDDRSLQLRQAPSPGEHRRPALAADQAALHNSWGRSRAAIRRKLRSTAHQEGWRTRVYYWLVWWPAPLTWRWLRNFHLLHRSLWPRLARLDPRLTTALQPEDRG